MILCNHLPVKLKKGMKTVVIKAAVYMPNMFNFFHSSNKMEQTSGPDIDAWVLTATPIKYIRF